MERRRDVRVSLDQTVRVTALGKNRQQIQGKAVDLSGRGIRITVPARVPPGAAVKIELDDALLLGEICYCRPCDRGFMIGVEIDQALHGLADLARLNQTLLNDGDSASDRRVTRQRRVILLGK